MQTVLTEEEDRYEQKLLIETEYLTANQARLVRRIPTWLALKDIDWLLYVMVSRKDWLLMVDGEMPITERPGVRRAIDDACKLVLSLRRVFPGQHNAGTSYHAGQWLHLPHPELGLSPWEHFAFGEIHRCEVLAMLGEMSEQAALQMGSPFSGGKRPDL